MVADRAGHEEILEELAMTQDKVAEQLKTLEPEQLVKATGEMGSALRSMSEVVKDSTAKVDAAASGKVMLLHRVLLILLKWTLLLAQILILLLKL